MKGVDNPPCNLMEAWQTCVPKVFGTSDMPAAVLLKPRG